MRIPGTDGHRFDQWSPRADAMVYAPVTEDIVDEPSPVTGIRRLDPDMLDGEYSSYVPSIPQ